jgi:hypothetical protein
MNRATLTRCGQKCAQFSYLDTRELPASQPYTRAKPIQGHCGAFNVGIQAQGEIEEESESRWRMHERDE